MSESFDKKQRPGYTPKHQKKLRTSDTLSKNITNVSMTSPVTRTVSHLRNQVQTLRTLRKVKFFIQPQTITVVTYYKETSTGDQYQYQGKAYIFTYKTWKGTVVSLAHTSHLPPPEEIDEKQNEEQEDIELAPAPILPGFGFSLTRPLFT